MKRTIPMYVRILLLLAVNLLVVAGVLLWVLKTYYGQGKDDLITSTVEGRMDGMARLLWPALNGAEHPQWDDILAQTGEANGVELALYHPHGEILIAGSDRELPDEIEKFLLERFFPRERRGELSSTKGSEIEPREPAHMGPPPHDRHRRGSPEYHQRRPMEGEHSAPVPPINSGPDGKPPGTVKIEKIGKFGDSATEMAVVHFWIKPRSDAPNDLMLIVWKASSGSQVFFSWNPLLYCFLGSLLLTGLLWVPFFYRVTRRLDILTEGAESISEGNFEIDVASDRGDELGRLSRSVQSMAVRLDEYVTGQKRFLGDIAHELCSPLVRIRMGLGVLEHQMEQADAEKLSDINDEVEELSQLVNELLDFSKASMKPDALEMEDVDLEGLCHDVVRRESGQELVNVHAPAGIVLKSRADLVGRALGNLVRNALRYASESGAIDLSVTELDQTVEIKVEDQGPGLPEEWLEKVFEPFSRPDGARTREDGGSGLGMAIAKTCVTSVGGEIYCENREQGGLRVVISLPRN